MKGLLLKKDQIIGQRYVVTDWLGEGGMQEVYAARDKLLSRDVALKVPKNLAAGKRFKRSASVSAQVNHNNVAKTLDYIEQGKSAFLIEEIIEGSDLSEVMQHLPLMPPQAVARVLHQLAKGIEASHLVGIIHRDLKPSNIMIVGGISLECVKITDFGIAKMAEQELAEWAEGDQTNTSSKTVMGAVPYMSPESISSFKTAGQPADIWAIGAIVYELLAGKKPFGQGLASIPAIMKGVPPPPPSHFSKAAFKTLGSEIFEIILKCLIADPSKRLTASQLVSNCENLCYTGDLYETGKIKKELNQYMGFIVADEGIDVFYNRENFYGDGVVKLGDRVWFARHDGGGNDRAFPIVKLK